MKWWHWLIIVVVGLAAVGALLDDPTTETGSVSTEAAPVAVVPDEAAAPSVPTNDPRVTLAEYNALSMGMSEGAAFEVIGGQCEENSRSELAGIVTVMYSCVNPGGANAILMFQDGALVQKSQFGLR